MAMQTGKSIFGKFGNRAITAFKQHANDQIERKNFGNLPAGIQGVARLIEIKFDVVKPDEQNKEKKFVGEYFFYAAGVVVEPTTFTDDKGNKHRVAGLRTNVTEMICDTPEKTGKNARKTIEQHIQWVMHLCRETLGAKFSGGNPQELEAWVTAVNTAIKSKTKPMLIYFNFETWKGEKATTGAYAGKEPLVQHFWRDLATDYVAPVANGVQDESKMNTDSEEEEDKDTEDKEQEEVEEKEQEQEEEQEEDNEEEEEESPKQKEAPKQKGKSALSAKTKESAKKGKEPSKATKPSANAKNTAKNPAKDDDEEYDLVALAERADQHNDIKAKAKLTEFAMKFKISSEVVRNADSWSDVVQLMLNPVEKEDTEEEEEEEEKDVEDTEDTEETEEQEEPEVPEVDNVVGYKPLNKEGKEFKTPVECLILRVNSAKKTVDLQNMANQKVYKGIAWDKISPWQS